MEHREEPREAGGAGYEVEDASVREVILSAVGLTIGTVIVALAVFGMFRVLKHTEVSERQPITDISAPAAFPPEPRLLQKPWEELEALRRKEDEMLTTYGWVNKGAGTARIPIERAMDLVVRRGLPTRSAGAPVARGATANVPR